MKHKNVVITETIRLSVGMLIALALMLAVYALIGYFSTAVLTGGIVGTVLSVANFFFMGVSIYNITSDEEETRASIRARGSFALRMVVLAALLVVAIKFGGCDPLATLIPLLAVRVVLTIEQFAVRSKITEAKEPPAAEPEVIQMQEEQHESSN